MNAHVFLPSKAIFKSDSDDALKVSTWVSSGCKIRSNLNILSKESNNTNKTNGNLEKDNETNVYSYDTQAMNKLFAKPEKTREEFDPTTKIGNSRHKKVNKRRMTNSVTRVKSNQSLTYKKEQPSQMGGSNSTT